MDAPLCASKTLSDIKVLQPSIRIFTRYIPLSLMNSADRMLIILAFSTRTMLGTAFSDHGSTCLSSLSLTYANLRAFPSLYPIAGSIYRCPLFNNAHAIRANLFAIATITTFLFARVDNAYNQLLTAFLFVPICLNTARAP